MRAVLTILLIFVIGFFAATATSKDCNFPHLIKHRTKLREIRGFKPEYISTAIGFGKRERPAEDLDVSDLEEISLPPPRNFPHDVSAKTFLRTIQANPALISLLMQLAMQNNRGDEESTMDHSKSEKTFALF